MALAVAPLTTAVMNAAPDALAGAASGVNNAASRLAGLFAVALVGAVTALVFASALDGSAPGSRFGIEPSGGATDRSAVAAAFSTAYGTGMAVSASLAALGALTAWRTVPSQRLRGPAAR
jgi:hypothetical protein